MSKGRFEYLVLFFDVLFFFGTVFSFADNSFFCCTLSDLTIRRSWIVYIRPPPRLPNKSFLSPPKRSKRPDLSNVWLSYDDASSNWVYLDVLKETHTKSKIITSQLPGHKVLTLRENSTLMKKSFRMFSTFCFLIMLMSCTDDSSSWKEGAIRKEGNYSYRDSLYINVDVKDHLVKFQITDSSRKEIAYNMHDFSDLHAWALYLDKDKSLWVLSSDIGYSQWKWNPETNQYKYVEFSHYLTKDEVPRHLYEDLKEFFD